MANTYKIQFAVTKIFGIAAKTVNFNILDDQDARVTGLQADLTAGGANGTTLTVSTTTGDYDYTLTVGTVTSSVPESLAELVTVQYNNEDINTEVNTLNLVYPYTETPSIDGYIGDVITLSWSQGTVVASDIASEDVASANEAEVTLVSEGNTTCKLTYSIEDDTYEASNIVIAVSEPEISDPVASDIDYNTATLTSVCTPTNPTMAKFRYGLKSEFDPEDDTTYTETKAAVNGGNAVLVINTLKENTEYSCQAVLIYANNTYVSSTVDFNTLDDPSTTEKLDIILDKDSINLVTSDVLSKEVNAEFERFSKSSTILWTAPEVAGYSIVLSSTDSTSTKATIKYTGEIESISSDISNDNILLVVTETVDEEVVAKGTALIKINLYNVINTMNLYIDDSNERVSEVEMTLNSKLTYNTITPDGNDGTIYSYNTESGIVTAVSEGAGKITVNISLEGDDDISDLNCEVNITVANAFVIPEDTSELLKICKVFNYKSQLFGDYRGKQFKKIALDEESELYMYAMRTNDPEEVKWKFDLCMLSTDFVRAQMLPLINQGE